MIRKAYKAGDKSLMLMADCIGVVVAEFRFHVIPWLKAMRSLVVQSYWKIMNVRPSNPFRTQASISRNARSSAQAEPRLTVTFPMRKSEEGKLYTYNWAVTRIEELGQQGVSDPVAYFNNEMADWWLAPDGMMDKEADFEGIARAIEEKWHS
ncbi:MAG: hypothetical protein JKY12_00395 [Sneathiella sp.]|nr:hypothetical protein [Sneathiella sp.]